MAESEAQQRARLNREYDFDKSGKLDTKAEVETGKEMELASGDVEDYKEIKEMEQEAAADDGEKVEEVKAAAVKEAKLEEGKKTTIPRAALNRAKGAGELGGKLGAMGIAALLLEPIRFIFDDIIPSMKKFLQEKGILPKPKEKKGKKEKK